MRKRTFILLQIIVFLSLSTLTYGLRFFGTIEGFWKNPIHGVRDYVALKYIRNNYASVFLWGLPAWKKPYDTPFSNALVIDGFRRAQGQGWTAELGNPFKIASILYQNSGAVRCENVNGVQLGLEMIIKSASVYTPFESENFAFDIAIENTWNLTGDPLKDADILSIVETGKTKEFFYYGEQYSLDLVGFSFDEGKTFSTTFVNPEGGMAEADIYAKILDNNSSSSHQPVPEPSTFLLLALSMIALVLIHKHLKPLQFSQKSRKII
jgi:hypothetical protein